jgi:hypothetical protein
VGGGALAGRHVRELLLRPLGGDPAERDAVHPDAGQVAERGREPDQAGLDGTVLGRPREPAWPAIRPNLAQLPSVSGGKRTDFATRPARAG